MQIEFVKPEAAPALRYSDLRTGKVFMWWQVADVNDTHPYRVDRIYLKGANGYTRLSTGDHEPPPSGNFRVIVVNAKLVVEEEA